jgi:hypothetical protein
VTRKVVSMERTIVAESHVLVLDGVDMVVDEMSVEVV